MIRIDVHPARENLTNMTSTLFTPVYVCLEYASCRRSPYVAIFHTDPTELHRFTAPKKKCSRLHLSARLSGLREVPQFLFQDNHWSSALKPNICLQQDTRLTGPISPVCDRYVQYLLTDTNHSVLNRHRRGLPHRKYQNSHSTLSVLPFRGFHWSP
jgi:hypothetical protein